MNGIYEKIYVIGQGAAPLACMKLLKDCAVPAVFLDTGGPMGDFSRKAAAAAGLAHEPVSGEDLPGLFGENRRALVLSANNTFIFPQKMVEMENLRILNYHNSLVPAHRGMHAEAWTIFAGDPLAGISWHVVDSGIDTGPLLVQKSLPVGALTSLGLLRRQCALAVAALSEYLPAILSGDAPLTAQAPCALPAHKRAERPNAGVLEPSWPAKKIWNFLRAFDYGALRTLGSPRCMIEGIWHTWEAYAPLDGTATGPEDWPIPAAGVVLKNIRPLRAADAG